MSWCPMKCQEFPMPYTQITNCIMIVKTSELIKIEKQVPNLWL